MVHRRKPVSGMSRGGAHSNTHPTEDGAEILNTPGGDGGGLRYHKPTECGKLERNSMHILNCCEIHTLAHGKGLAPPLGSLSASGMS